MFYYAIKQMTLDKFVIKKIKNEKCSYLKKIAYRVSRGHTLWESDGYRFVMPYELLASIVGALLITVIIKIFFYSDEVNWFKTILDVQLIGGTLVLCFMHLPINKRSEDLINNVDEWWTYKYLDEETLEFKNEIQEKLDLVTRIFINVVSYIVFGYAMLPFFKYFYNGAKSLEDMMVVDSLLDAPWIHFEIVSGAVTVLFAGNNCGHVVAKFIAVLFTHKKQLQLAGIAISTIEDRVIRMMEDWNGDVSSFDETFEYLVHNEIKSCAKHFQAIYRQTKQLYKDNNSMVNYANYVGCGIITVIGVLLAKERDRFLMIQVSCGIMPAITGLLFIISYPIDSLMTQVELFRVQVYGSAWYNLPLSCQKSSHIMQTMVRFCPKFKTYWGSEVSLEFFGKLLNASYYYITTILSMVVK